MAKKKKARAGNEASPKWQLAAYQTSGGSRPAFDFLSSDDMPAEVRRELLVTVTAVAASDPRTFRSLGDRWTFMKKPKAKGQVDMSGIAEARDKHRHVLYRLFCVVDSDAQKHGLAAPTVVLLGGGSKPVREAMPQSVYRRIDGYRHDYWKNHRVAAAKHFPDWWPKIAGSPS